MRLLFDGNHLEKISFPGVMKRLFPRLEIPRKMWSFFLSFHVGSHPYAVDYSLYITAFSARPFHSRTMQAVFFENSQTDLNYHHRSDMLACDTIL